MKFSSSVKTIATAVVFFLQTANAETVKSDIFGWNYVLVSGAPGITTYESITTISTAYNHTVGIELVNGTIMMMDMMANKQIATFGGALDTWARSNYASQDILNDPASIEKMKNIFRGHLDSVRTGMSMEDSLALMPTSGTRGTDEGSGSIDERSAVCWCAIVPISCFLGTKCKGICIAFLCSYHN